MEKYWICGNMDGFGEPPDANLAVPLPENLHQLDNAAWRKFLLQPEVPASRQELTEILNAIDQLRDPD